jgi:CubicO group peptidase (beta-lactamase class C family)
LKSSKRVLLVLLVVAVAYIVHYCWVSFPIATGYGAKVVCSAVFVSGRNEKEVIARDLDFTPFQIVSINVDRGDSSVTASIFGLARKKAIFRNGFGSTLLNGYNERELRSQAWKTPSPPMVNQDTLPWPMGNIRGPYPSSVDSLKVSAAIEKIFRDSVSGEGINETRALIVVYNGQIIAERYGTGFSDQTRLTGWSMTKSVTGAIVGILASRGKIHIDGRADVPEWRKTNDLRHGITVRNLLQQTSGLSFDEIYHKKSHANTMLFLKGDVAHYAALRPLEYKPGTVFQYTSGNTNILSRICRQAVGDEAYHSLPYEELFYKIGMHSALLEPDASGTFIGSSHCYATARDWARFGMMYCDSGRFAGRQILSATWVLESTSPSAASPRGEYGFQWWLNRGSAADKSKRIYAALPTDMFFADGFEGQNIFIIPSKKLVVVRLGLTRKRQWGESLLLQELITLLP